MELTQLKYFLAAAKEQHITRSAEKLNIAQPALTKSLKRLEEELGVPLFEKSGRNVVLTVYGKHLMERFSPMAKAIDELPKELSRLAEREAETVRICVLSASMPVTRAVMDFRRNNPSVNFQITQNMTDSRYDIKVTSKLPAESMPSEGTHIIKEELFLAVPDTDEYEGMTSAELADMKEKGFVSLIGSKHLRVICDRFCRNAGFEPNIIFESDSPDAARNMIEAGLGIGFWPEYSWGSHPGGKIKLLRISTPQCRRELLITKSEGSGISCRAEQFFEYLVEYFDGLRLL